MLTNISNCRETLSSFCIHELGIRGRPLLACLGGMLVTVPFCIIQVLIVSLSSANLGVGRKWISSSYQCFMLILVLTLSQSSEESATSTRFYYWLNDYDYGVVLAVLLLIRRRVIY